MQKKVFLFSLVAMFLFASCRSGGGKKIPKEGDSNLIEKVDSLPKTEIAQTINVYIENSGSMDGYVNGDFTFKEAISSLLAKLPYHYDKNRIKIHFINSRIDSSSTVEVNVTNFSQNLNLFWDRAKATRSGLTSLNSIFKDILEQTDNKTISILFSDCIYSIGQGDVKGLLTFQKNLTMSAFLQKSKNDKVPLATTIVKMKSRFNGKYFPYTGDINWFPFDGERPYYICVIANQEILNDFNNKIELKPGKIEGFENKYVLSSEPSKNIYYSVLQSTYNRGRFKPDRNLSKRNYIHGIEEVDIQTRGGGCTRGKEAPLTFAVAVDFKNIQAEDDYLKDPSNYIVTTNNFTIDSIISVDKNKIKPIDWNRIATSNPTHIILLTAKTQAVSDVSFVLKKQMPQWIIEGNTEDDTDNSKINGGQTFGLYHWVTGIREAYETIYPNNNNHFECSISIK